MEFVLESVLIQLNFEEQPPVTKRNLLLNVSSLNIINVKNFNFSRRSTYFKRQETFCGASTRKHEESPNAISNSSWAGSARSIMCWALLGALPVLACTLWLSVRSDNVTLQIAVMWEGTWKWVCVFLLFNRVCEHLSEVTLLPSNSAQVGFVHTCLMASDWTNSS